MKHPSTRVGLLAAALLLAGCPSSADVPADDDDASPEPTPEEAVSEACRSDFSESHAAVIEFRRTLEATDYDARDAAVQAIEQALIDNPDEAEFGLLQGLGNLWLLAETGTSPQGPAQQGYLDRSIAGFERAEELCPGDLRIPGWRGSLLVGAGQEAAGWEAIDEAAEGYPEFAEFIYAFLYAQLPVSDPDFQLALDYIDSNLSSCDENSLDPSCNNAEYALHNIEGYWLFVGDVKTKAGDTAGALVAYQEVRDGAGWDGWNFQDWIDDREATVDQRAADWADGDPANDPQLSMATDSSCSLCHAD
jgi:tetratricopeptide (TPR) repeat protein